MGAQPGDFSGGFPGTATLGMVGPADASTAAEPNFMQKLLDYLSRNKPTQAASGAAPGADAASQNAAAAGQARGGLSALQGSGIMSHL